MPLFVVDTHRIWFEGFTSRGKGDFFASATDGLFASATDGLSMNEVRILLTPLLLGDAIALP